MDSFFVQFVAWAWEWKYAIALVIGAGFFQQLMKIPKQDRVFSLYMCSSFFLIITSYWILKPLKKALFIGYHKAHEMSLFGSALNPAQAELLAKELNVLVAFIAMMVFTVLAKNLKREHYTMLVIAFFALCLALFYPFMEQMSELTVWTFYLFGDLFITGMLLVFFSFLNDSFSPKSAKLSYSLIGIGGVLGGFFGSAVVAEQSIIGDPPQAVLWCLGLVIVILIMEHLATHLVAKRPVLDYQATVSKPVETEHKASALEGARLAMRSSYLRWLAGIVMLYEITSIVVDYQFTTSVLHWVDSHDYKMYFASVYAFSNFTALIIQVFLTGLIIRRFGLTVALMILPLSVLLGSVSYLFYPILLFGSLLNTFDYAFAYSIQQTAKELLYVPIARKEKYEAKAFIDTFLLRLGKGLAVLMVYMGSLWMIGTTTNGFSVLLIVCMIAWVGLSIAIGRHHKQLEINHQAAHPNQ
ncbi:MAG: hypothetical protein HY849_07435 [Nitrosomonadales bacterium]|nr:hypothetical protein [Nitrosomonadales bacterium]